MSSENSPSPLTSGYFVHPQAICETATVGAGTRIWAFAHILPGAKVGKECNICDGVFIENDVVLGDNVTIKCGVQLWDGLTLEDNAFVGPNATFTNTMYPRSKEYQKAFLRTVVRKNASVGANATILPGITIGENAMVGAGSVVTQSVPANAIVFGNPARIVGYVDAHGRPIESDTERANEELAPTEGQMVIETGVRGVTLHRFNQTGVPSGTQSYAGFVKELPFPPSHYSLLSGVPGDKARGQFAYRLCRQFLVCVKGACSVVVDDGLNRREIELRDAECGLLLPAMVWATQYKFTADAMLLVFVSAAAASSDRIEDYSQFLGEVGH